ncbi:CU044_5270 family protein [Streptomyces sp. NPDC050418]|uniref:CU044_5270 family protein n=1 Tax=Streptomyces sp. NPDC050418 TaxID=3365612 RepID=UPI0037A05DF0
MTDELDRLREWDEPALDDDARHRARVRLFTVMNEQPSAARPLWRRPVLRILATGVVTAAVAATVLVTVDGTRPDQQAKPPASSSPNLANVSVEKVLNGAADWDRANEKGVVPPRNDQFIYSKRIIKETEQKTGEVKEYTDEMWISVDGSKRSLSSELGNPMWEEALGEGEGVWPPVKWDDLKELPTDPEKLVPVIVNSGPTDKEIGDLTKTDRWQAYFLLGALLEAPVLPEGLRAAAYEGLALIPGVETIPDVKDSAGRRGVGIAYPDHFPGRYLIFDEKTYEFLGFRDERISADGKKKYTQLSHTVEWAAVEKVYERP